MAEVKNAEPILLDVQSLSMEYPVYKGFMQTQIGMLRAVDRVSLQIRKGETLGLVGESGCGKSTLGKCLLRGQEPTGGAITYRFENQEAADIIGLSGQQLRESGFRKKTHMIFQDPKSSLNPRRTVLDIISEPMLVNGMPKGKEMIGRVQELMNIVGLDSKYLKRYPHAFSGGQRQRISIARALATRPEFVVADEPTAALDVSVQAQILNLLKELQEGFGLTYLFISHNLGVVRFMCDRIAVMYLGQIVESGTNDEVFTHPLHPYTEALLKSVPIADPQANGNIQSIEGEIGSPLNPPSGCRFHTRCKYATELCKTKVPPLREISPGHYAACHYAESLALLGINSQDVK